MKLRSSYKTGMPFKFNYGQELFNDCLSFLEQARNALSAERKGRIFAARTALRASYYIHKEEGLLKKINAMKATRIELVHPSFRRPFVFEERYFREIEDGIVTTRRFFKFLTEAGRYIPSTLSYLNDEKSVDLDVPRIRVLTVGREERGELR